MERARAAIGMMENAFLTPDQKRAVESRGKNLVVVAGAGSGKTRVLVERYLHLLDRGFPTSRVVAITFTDKAAREMRDRVRAEIEKRAAVTGARDAAKWRMQLEDIDAARISTIHSLCAALLRANPVEARLDPGFQVVEETDAAIWQDETIDSVLAELVESGGDGLRLLSEYEVSTVREILATLLRRGSAAWEAFEQLPASPEDLLTAWQVRLDRAQRQALDELLKSPRWREPVDWIHSHASTDAEDKLEVVRGDDQALIDLMEPTDFEQVLGILRVLSSRPKVGTKGRAQAWEDVKAARQVVNSLRDLARDYVDRYDLTLGDVDRQAAALIFQWRALYRGVRERYAQRKSAERALDYNDLEEQARSLLSDHQNIRERYRVEFASVLVDEFQDTNRAQRDIIYALASPLEPDRLFIVADGKQSIYGFRGADVSVLAETTRFVTDRWGDDARILLPESFRAHDRLVRAVNHLFARLFAVAGERAAYEIPYEEMRGVRASTDREPIIEIVQIPDTMVELGKLSMSERREWEARELAQRLHGLVQEGFAVWDEEAKATRPARWGDMALLFRASTYFATYEEAFKAAHVPYVVLAGKGYYDRAEVRDLIQLLRALDNPQDDLALATVLRSPLFALSDETLYYLRSEGKPFRQALAEIPEDVVEAERERASLARECLETLWARVGRVPILELLTYALEETHFLATITALEDGERRRANVEKLLALARRTGRVRLSEFNAYLQDLTTREVREGEAPVDIGDAVQIMTIHRAKGLEFPIVVIPDASRPPRETVETLLTDAELGPAVTVRDDRGQRVQPAAFQLARREEERRARAEEKRLLYVAATRARDYIILSGASKAKEDSYLAQVLAALDGRTQFDWGTVLIHGPQGGFRPKESAAQEPIELKPIAAGAEPAAEGKLPALGLPLPMPAVGDLRSFAPTGLELLVKDRAEFERHALEGAPDRIRPILRGSELAHAPATVVGEMAHKALKQWRFPETTPNLDAMLEAYAQEQGLADAREIQVAIRETARLLHKFSLGELCREMNQAVVRRHEVPFVVPWQGRWIHGALDAVYQTPEGEWYLVDFKSDRWGTGPIDVRAYTLENYGVQIALYLQAATARWGQVGVRVHYVREDTTISLTAADLAPALERAAAAVAARGDWSENAKESSSGDSPAKGPGTVQAGSQAPASA